MKNLLLLFYSLFISAIIFAQNKTIEPDFIGEKPVNITNLNSGNSYTGQSIETRATMGCGNAGFYDIQAASPYYCNETIQLDCWDSLAAGGYIMPAFGVTVTTNSYSDTENHVYIYEDGVLFYDDLFAIPENSDWTLYGGGMSPTAIYRYQWCDDNDDESFPWHVNDLTNDVELASGTWAFPVGGSAPHCHYVDFGPLGGTYEFITNAPAGLHDYGNGSAYFVCSEAGPGTYTFQYQFTNADGSCSGLSTIQTITVEGPTADAGNTQTTCAGVPVTIGSSPTAAGGVAGYTYSWAPTTGLSSSTAANPSATITATTTYTVTVTDVNGLGCEDVSTVVVNVNPLPVITPSSNTALCIGDTLELYETGNDATSWSWTGPNAFSSTDHEPVINGVTSSANGVYNVTGTITATGCFASSNTSVVVNNLPNVTASSDDADDAICNGESIALTGGGADSYTWDLGVNDGISFTPAGTDTYTVEGQNAITGCKNTAQILITVNPLPIIYAGADQDITYGSSTTINDATPAGLTTYSWTPVDSLVDATIQNPTTEVLHITNTFTLTGTDANGCTNSDDVNINIIGGPLSVILSAVQNDSICLGDSVLIIASASGASGNYTYNWSSLPTGTYVNNDTIVVNPTADTEYYIHVVDGANNAYDTISVTVTSLPVITSVIATDLQCNGDDSGEINITATGNGNLSYSINDGIDFFSNNGQFSNMSIGTGFISIVEDEFGCISYGDTVDVNQPLPLQTSIVTFNDATCGTANGDITLTTSGGTPAYSYVWTTGGTPSADSTYVNVISGNYTVTVSDTHNCDDTLSFFIDDLGGGTVSVLSAIDANCYNEGSGTMSAVITGGIPTYVYYITQGTDTLVNEASSDSTFALDTLSAGSYNIHVQEGVGCMTSSSFIIGEPTDITITDSIIDIRCFGVNDGQIFITIDGGTPNYTYLWSNGENSISVDSLSFGNYSVVVTDNNGCTKVKDSLWINTPLELVGELKIDNYLKCFNDSIGELTVVADSGTAPYSYLWSNAETTSTIMNLTAGNYSVIISDNHGCTLSFDTSLTSPTQLLISDTLYYANYLGNISVAGFGGSPNYSYEWSNGVLDSSITNLTSGNYWVSVIDANGCIAENYYKIEIPLIVPSVITPNADGKNDFFRITNINAFAQIDIKIFNRWGDVIFDYSGSGSGYEDSSQQWDGMYNGKDLPIGSYVYIIDLKNGEEPYTGTVTIVR